MVDQHLLGWISALVLGLVAVVAFVSYEKARRQRNRIAALAARGEGVKSVTTTKTSTDGEIKSGDVDVIIVGAGVAGSALAHTLGKVIPFRF